MLKWAVAWRYLSNRYLGLQGHHEQWALDHEGNIKYPGDGKERLEAPCLGQVSSAAGLVSTRGVSGQQPAWGASAESSTSKNSVSPKH